jgi:hypothetical protein
MGVSFLPPAALQAEVARTQRIEEEARRAQQVKQNAAL